MRKENMEAIREAKRLTEKINKVLNTAIAESTGDECKIERKQLREIRDVNINTAQVIQKFEMVGLI